MRIEGSIPLSWSNANETKSFSLPKPGLTVVGMSISNYWASIQFTPGKNAIIPSDAFKLYKFVPVTFPVTSGEVIITNGNNAGANSGILYYGTPDKDNIPIDAFSGIAVNPTISVPASASNAKVVTPFNLNFPNNVKKIIGTTYQPAGLTSSITRTSGTSDYFTIQTSAGETLNVFVGESVKMDFPNRTGILPLDIKVVSVLSASYTGTYSNSSTSSVDIGAFLIFYYE